MSAFALYSSNAFATLTLLPALRSEEGLGSTVNRIRGAPSRRIAHRVPRSPIIAADVRPVNEVFFRHQLRRGLLYPLSTWRHFDGGRRTTPGADSVCVVILCDKVLGNEHDAFAATTCIARFLPEYSGVGSVYFNLGHFSGMAVLARDSVPDSHIFR
ncbi:hypothetical protein B9Z19DRAFT_1128209 [Tuber borchii]|uniref:Uncharacterized protein n=1 Tax=Tuber borchii TaxID=42251 RepID=A0A2T6ZPY0_TUBBO|nr:hypothetical protein B9Z19DRAFT_1128209 [Tuber borchii]